MERSSDYVDPLAMFEGHPEIESINIDHFVDIQSADIAARRLEYLRSPRNIAHLVKHGYGGEPVNRMWRGVIRGCIAHGVPLPSPVKQHAAILGVVVE